MFNLRHGDKVGIISPASFINQGDIDNGLAYLRSCGLIPVPGRHAYAQWRYMGGTPQQRAEDIMDFYRDDTVKAVFATRGGGGSSYILPFLDFELVKSHPKPVFGLSDITILQNALYAQSKCFSYSGILLKYDFEHEMPDALLNQSFQNIINGRTNNYGGGQTVISGSAQAPAVGGNLTALSYLFGTPYMPDLNGKILFLEDIGGKSFWIDLRLEQLRQTPGFNELKGIVFGEFRNCVVINKEDGTPDEIIDSFCKRLTIPVIKHFPYGHISARHILPVGLPVTMTADTGTVTF